MSSKTKANSPVMLLYLTRSNYWHITQWKPQIQDSGFDEVQEYIGYPKLPQVRPN